MRVYKSSMQTVDYHAEQSLMKVIVSSNTEYLGDEKYQKEQLNLLATYKQYQPKYILIDVQDLLYSIPNEMQEWTATRILEPMIDTNLKRLAYIIPQDFYSQLSIELLIDEMPQKNFIKRLFANEKTAMDWLLSQ